MEHVSDDRQAMQELLRVMKPGGLAILQVPIAFTEAITFEDSSIITPEDRLRYYGQQDHVRLYGRDYPKRLEEIGFHVYCCNFAKENGINFAIQNGIDPREDLFACYKPISTE